MRKGGIGIFVIVLIAFFSACGTTSRPVAVTPVQNPIPSPPADYSPAELATYYYLEGIRLANINDDFRHAFSCYQMALEYDSLHAPSLYELSNLLTGRDPAKALEYSRKASLSEPDNIWYKQQLGRLYIWNERYDSARTIYGEMIRMAPENPENYRYLAALHEETGDMKAAISLLDSAEMRFGPIEELSLYKRQLLISTGQTGQAIEETLSQIQNFPYDDRNFVILGDLYSRTGKDSLARDAFNQALAINPHSTDAWIGLNEFYRSRNDIINFLASTKQLFVLEDIPLDTKLSFFNDAIKNPVFYQQYYGAVEELVATLEEAYPGNEQVLKLYAEHQINSGNLEGALQSYKNALSDSSSLEVFTMIIDIESYLEHPDSALYYTDKALARFPQEPDLYLRKGYTLMGQEDYRGAIRAMEEALVHTPADSAKSVIYSSIGDVVHQQYPQDMHRTYSYYDKALEYDPDNIHALNNYSYFLSVDGKKLDKALKMIERVMELEPGNPTYIDTYAWVLFKLGRWEEAKTAMRQAVSLDRSESMELMIHYGDILYELKEYYLASVYWQKALEKGYEPDAIESRLKKIEGK